MTTSEREKFTQEILSIMSVNDVGFLDDVDWYNFTDSIINLILSEKSKSYAEGCQVGHDEGYRLALIENKDGYIEGRRRKGWTHPCRT